MNAIETFNKVNGYVGSVTSKLGVVGGKIGDCLTSVDWSDLWTGPKVPLDETIKNIKVEIKKLWDTLVGLFKIKPGPDSVKAKNESKSEKNRRRRQVPQDE